MDSTVEEMYCMKQIHAQIHYSQVLYLVSNGGVNIYFINNHEKDISFCPFIYLLSEYNSMTLLYSHSESVFNHKLHITTYIL